MQNRCSAGYNLTCSILPASSRLACWGGNQSTFTTTVSIPKDIYDQSTGRHSAVLTVDAGVSHTCAIQLHTRRLVCWGYNRHGETDVPFKSVNKCDMVRLGMQFTCAVKARVRQRVRRQVRDTAGMVDKDGTVWGLSGGEIHGEEGEEGGGGGVESEGIEAGSSFCYENESGVCVDVDDVDNLDLSINSNIFRSLDNIPPNNHYNNQQSPTLYIQKPTARHPQLPQDATSPLPLDSLFKWTKSRLHCWGDSFHGIQVDQDLYQKFNINETVSLAAGLAHACAGFTEEPDTSFLRSLQTVSNFNENYSNSALSAGVVWFCWGGNNDGQTDIPDTLKRSRGQMNGSQTRDVYAGYRHTCMLSGRGKVTCFGWNQQKQCSPPVYFKSGIDKLSMGFKHSCAIRLDLNHDYSVGAKKDKVGCWGGNDDGQSLVSQEVAVNARDVCAGYLHTCASDGRGFLSCWGQNSKGQCDVPGEARLRG